MGKLIKFVAKVVKCPPSLVPEIKDAERLKGAGTLNLHPYEIQEIDQTPGAKILVVKFLTPQVMLEFRENNNFSAVVVPAGVYRIVRKTLRFQIEREFIFLAGTEIGIEERHLAQRLIHHQENRNVDWDKIGFGAAQSD